MTSTNDNNNDLPEYIEGIPTEKKRRNERYSLINKYYDNLWRKLQREGRGNKVKNKFLNEDIYVVKNESDKKTVREALHNWKSTFAVKHLREVIKEAKPSDDLPLFVSRKEGDQKRNGYKSMIILYNEFKNKEKQYMNFRVKLTIGVKSNGKHIQYCVNKVEAK